MMIWLQLEELALFLFSIYLFAQLPFALVNLIAFAFAHAAVAGALLRFDQAWQRFRSLWGG
jgi:hypothetical protein